MQHAGLVVVTCGEELFAETIQDNLLNPTLIIEVLSDSTEAYDRGKKFELYQQIESLAEYILISQYELKVEPRPSLGGGSFGITTPPISTGSSSRSRQSLFDDRNSRVIVIGPCCDPRSPISTN